MLGSQALDTIIGLVAMFFILATTASAIVEIGSQLISARGKQLTNHLKRLLGDNYSTFTNTSVLKPLNGAIGFFKSNSRAPSYLSAVSFTNAVSEMTLDSPTIEALDSSTDLSRRLKALNLETNGDLLKIKAGLEHWYDDQMDRLAGKYKRVTSSLLFVLGFLLAMLVNGSAVHVADRLWNDEPIRTAVAAAAEDLTAVDADGVSSPPTLESVAESTEALTEIGLPVGWGDGFLQESTGETLNWPAHVFGWIVTGLMVMMGAPFWFDLLSRLVPLRKSGTKPAKAVDDVTSASAQLAA